MNDVSDEVLLQRYLQGDLTSFTLLYDKHKGGVYRYLLRQTKDRQLAEDLFQDSWGNVIQHASSFQPSAKFSTWLYTIARHKLIDHVRHDKIVEAVIDTNQSNIDDDLQGATSQQNQLEKQISQQRQQNALQRCIRGLPVLLLDVFLLKEEGGMTQVQIAEIVNANHEATKSRARNAYRQLRKCLSVKLNHRYIVNDSGE
ncbi:sigma-70 family RNA polymerase sigma factor [Aliiglaciecola sp. LCG003]|uniref:sigma-70 family RNA polymerase sigma factor n=1 Tax=Aliiglaciecola sp. LCG003 TaxID=3053655 RepID=UPI002572D00C|nr:sigma-70 family RNA polymerase sigma factor [Aliiglaciecola sp. LCG003]WJG10808.1 sigma-70 family RNA polymerase sigma factor [Aliiglaciecola sp. LCG003]